MGWKGYEVGIPAGMIFKKMFCSKCGKKLKKQKISKTFKKGEEGFENNILGSPTIGMTEKTKATYIYICSACNNTITYEQQVEISKKQKQLNTKIIKEN